MYSARKKVEPYNEKGGGGEGGGGKRVTDLVYSSKLNKYHNTAIASPIVDTRVPLSMNPFLCEIGAAPISSPPTPWNSSLTSGAVGHKLPCLS